MPVDFDVIIVGCGPAGTASAITCRKNGLQTLVLGAKPATADIPGESLHPGMGPLFRALDVELEVETAKFLRYPGRTVYSGGHFFSEPFGGDSRGQWMGYQANRIRLNQILLSKAAASGANIVMGCPAERLVIKNRRVAGVVAGARIYTSKFVIDAGGGRQWLARQLKTPRLQVSPRLTAHFGWVTPNRGCDTLNVPEFRMEGATWLWVAPVDADRCAWVQLDLANHEVASQVSLPTALQGNAIIGKPSSRDVTWKLARPCAGPGYFLVGDAAWVLDPACSHGVFKAVTSGMIAAEAVARSLQGSADAHEQQRGYTAWAENWFCSDAEALIGSYSGKAVSVSWLDEASGLLRKIVSSPSEHAFKISR